MVLDLVLTGLAITLEPFPLLGFVLLLSAGHGTAKGAAFVLGWMACLVAVIAGVLLATGGQPLLAHTAPSATADAVKIALGAGLIWYGARRWRRRAAPRKRSAWMSKPDGMSLWAAALLAPVLQPWMLVAAGAATVTSAKLSTWEDYLVLAGFCVLASASFVILELNAALRPETAATRLDHIRWWIDSHAAIVAVVVSVLIGCWLIGKSGYLLAT